MNIPKIKFRKMTLEENVNIIKWAYFECNGSLDVKKCLLNYFPELNNIDKFKIDRIKGNEIAGNINVTTDSYFNLSIPYDKGYKIYLDNKIIKYEKTNKSFVGFKINKGKHNINYI